MILTLWVMCPLVMDQYHISSKTCSCISSQHNDLPNVYGVTTKR